MRTAATFSSSSMSPARAAGSFSTSARASNTNSGSGLFILLALPLRERRPPSCGKRLERKKTATEAAKARRTFGEVADMLIASKRPEWRNEKHAQQWESSLREILRRFAALFVDAIGTPEVLGVLQPLWAKMPVIASRIRGRIEAVLAFARARGWRNGDNPAAWRGHLALVLPRRARLEKRHHPAMPYRDIPSFLAGLPETVPSLALRFAILTAARQGEVLGARWSEIDLASPNTDACAGTDESRYRAHRPAVRPGDSRP